MNYDLFNQPDPIRIHRAENNQESRDNLMSEKKHFESQTERLIRYMKNGGTITSRQAMVEFNIWHLARRIADLRAPENGYNIQSRWIKPERGAKFKEYFLTQ